MSIYSPANLKCVYITDELAREARDFFAYRQALRDITAQSGFPNEVVWPTKPE
jgi:hypothetical protein